MKHLSRFTFGLVLVFGMLTIASPTSTARQNSSIPAAAPTCMVGVEIQPLAQAMPPDAGGQALIVARLSIAPGFGFNVHTHSGILTVTVDSGHLTFTQVDEGEMVVNRADGTTETVVVNEALVLDSGDWLVETEGMLHMAWNKPDEPAVVILSGLIDPTLPLIQCAE